VAAGGRELSYFTAINYSSSPRNQADFAAFFASIVDSGVREIHVLCHSVGAHVLFSALHLIEPMLQTVAQQSQTRRFDGSSGGAVGERPTARLATCLIMSPDYPLRKFISSDFNRLRKLCSCITLYCDVSDRALTYSEIFNREKALGKNPFMLVRNDNDRRGGRGGQEATCDAATHDDDVEGTMGAGRGLNDGGLGDTAINRLSFGMTERQGVLSWVASLGEYMGDSVPAMFRQSPALETDLTSRLRHEGVPLDMDVIDTSWMDSNVQSLRHNYFNVNRYMIDDIRDVISTKRRAHFRNRLTHRRGNVWSFLGAPKYIVNA